MDLEGGFFLVRFSNQDDYVHALFEGPWMIADHYLLIQRWRPLFMPQEMEVHKLAVWVRIPNLPVELYNRYFLWKVGKILGTMLRIDENTSIHSSGKFARICVKIDLRKQLVPSFATLGKEFYLVYEGLHQICFYCERYGHKMDDCLEMRKHVTGTNFDQGGNSDRNHHKENSNICSHQKQDQNLQNPQKGKEKIGGENNGTINENHNTTVSNPQQSRSF
ncbi:uncharacterized protein LOC130966685 [Arachis stenosperma]|uniref:uncharacterized protein LOC130966685 n=1 Tax=Arachis stenosperma TaxID=217475 RepID=UPI0025ABB1F1|nr:uncharacterized protein LOC130966685 [Arachis stenosperma]